MIIAMTGVTGNMGREALREVLTLPFIEKVKVLVLCNDNRLNKIIKQYKLPKAKIEVIKGNLNSEEAIKKLIKDTTYVVSMAAFIPPHSDKDPKFAVDTNDRGVKNLVKCIEEYNPKIKLIHISTLALYGNRNEKHPFARVGDPIIVSPFDIYSLSKMRGEYYVLESNIDKFVVLRQTAMMHDNLLNDNLSDGLMFHTCFNSPLEWLSARDSGLLIKNIIKRDYEQKDLDKVFWKKCFNMSGGVNNRITGFDTLDLGFKLLNGSCKDFFKPNYNASRNFHGVWFYDEDKLENLFNYQRESVTDFFANLAKVNKGLFSLAKLAPKSLIRHFGVTRLFKDSNSPYFWYKHNDLPRLQSYFGGKKAYEALPRSFNDFPLFCEGFDQNKSPINFNKVKTETNPELVNLFFDETKDSVTIDDIKNFCFAHGGKLISDTYSNDVYERLEFENQDGLRFKARVYTVLYCGHFLNNSYFKDVWEYDRLSKNDKIYSQVYYDSHKKDENYIYYFTDKFIDKMQKFDE